MTDEQVGKYIRLICLQHMKGELSEKDMLFICKSHDEEIWNKFERTAAGTFINRRLQEVIEKRKNYSESRRKNRAGKTKDVNDTSLTYDNHMGNGNGNENVIEKKGGAGGKKRKPFVPPKIQEVVDFFVSEKFPKELGEHVFKYYSDNDWKDSEDKPFSSWRQKMRGNWMKEKNRNWNESMAKQQQQTPRYQTYNPDIHK
jgi:hypothetical protein